MSWHIICIHLLSRVTKDTLCDTGKSQTIKSVPAVRENVHLRPDQAQVLVQESVYTHRPRTRPPTVW
jgi:hypothetical protein